MDLLSYIYCSVTNPAVVTRWAHIPRVNKWKNCRRKLDGKEQNKHETRNQREIKKTGGTTFNNSGQETWRIGENEMKLEDRQGIREAVIWYQYRGELDHRVLPHHFRCVCHTRTNQGKTRPWQLVASQLYGHHTILAARLSLMDFVRHKHYS